jgi:hypothetical protein
MSKINAQGLNDRNAWAARALDEFEKLALPVMKRGASQIHKSELLKTLVEELNQCISYDKFDLFATYGLEQKTNYRQVSELQGVGGSVRFIKAITDREFISVTNNFNSDCSYIRLWTKDNSDTWGNVRHSVEILSRVVGNHH